MTLVWLEQSQRDMRAIFRHISQDNPNAATKLINLIQEQAIMLCHFPQMGKQTSLTRVRALVVHVNYTIYYRESAQNLQIVRIKHNAQQWP